MPKGQMRFYKAAACLRANSTAVADAIRRELPPAHHPRVITIPNPLPFTPSQPVDFSRKQPLILYVGRLHPEKGLDLLIQAYRQTSQQYRLQLVGPWEVAAGGGGKAYLNQLKRLAGDASVEFVGPVYDIDALNDYYQQARVFAYPSVSEEGETFGLAPLEAMAWGCTPVVSDLRCFKDFIEGGRNGLIFDHRTAGGQVSLSACLEELQKKPELGLRLGAEAVKVRQSHSVEFIAEQFIDQFQRITAIGQAIYVD